MSNQPSQHFPTPPFSFFFSIITSSSSNYNSNSDTITTTLIIIKLLSPLFYLHHSICRLLFIFLFVVCGIRIIFISLIIILESYLFPLPFHSLHFSSLFFSSLYLTLSSISAFIDCLGLTITLHNSVSSFQLIYQIFSYYHLSSSNSHPFHHLLNYCYLMNDLLLLLCGLLLHDWRSISLYIPSPRIDRVQVTRSSHK